jgi:hypothetical protein
MTAAATDYFTEVGNPGTATTLAAPGHTIGGTSFTVVSTTNWPTNTGVVFAVDNYTLQTVNGVPNTAVRTAGTYTEWEGVVASSTTITGAVLRYGTDQNYSAGSLTRLYIPVASSRENRLAQGIQVQHNQDGTHSAITATSVTATGTITAASFVQSGGSGANGWTVGLNAPNTVTYNGNHSYNMVFNGVDYTSTLSPGMRLRTTRTIAAPTQCTSLNGTTQYYSKSSPAGMTFTDDFVVSAWVKLSSYTATDIVSRYNGTSGWELQIQSTGQITLLGRNASASNYSYVQSYQSIPLNKWVHIAAQLDMSSFTASTTTSYIMLDGVDVPAQVARAGTNPTALVQAGNLEIGSQNGGLTPLAGKIAQVAIFNAKVTQSTMQGYMSQGLAGTETSLISAYSFNNSINDLNANANNLTANGSAVATNADSPFGGQSNGAISSTLDYGIVQSAAFSTNTTVVVQVPEGCTIPTSGGVTSVVYSSNKVPYLFPGQRGKWNIDCINKTSNSTAAVLGTWYNLGSAQLNVPLGEWNIAYSTDAILNAASGGIEIQTTLATSSSTETETLLSANLHTTTATEISGLLARNTDVSTSTATLYYLLTKAVSGSSTTAYNQGSAIPTLIRVQNAHL